MEKKRKFIVIVCVLVIFFLWTTAQMEKKDAEYKELISLTEKHFDAFSADAKNVINGKEEVSFESISKDYILFSGYAKDWSYALRDKADAGGDSMLMLECVDFRDAMQEFYFDLVHMYYIEDKEKAVKKMTNTLHELEAVLDAMIEEEAAL